MTRAYVGADLTQVLAWYDAGVIPAGTRAVSVTSALRQAHPEADEEELEFVATEVAHAQAAGRPAVVAIDVDGLNPNDTLVADVPVGRWAALLVDDLQWYAVSEVDSLR